MFKRTSCSVLAALLLTGMSYAEARGFHGGGGGGFSHGFGGGGFHSRGPGFSGGGNFHSSSIAPGRGGIAHFGGFQNVRGSYGNRYYGGGVRMSPGYWRTGNWNHSWHNGRYGWWWVLGGTWLLFNNPIYPYPAYSSSYATYYDDPAMIDDDGTGPVHYGYSSRPYSFYCDDPAGYYPNVSSCYSGWREVVSSPAPSRTTIIEE